MIAKQIPVHFLLLLSALLLLSCYREEPMVVDEKDVFELSTTSFQQEFILESRDTSYSISDPNFALRFNQILLPAREMRIRGNSALDYRRKSFSVHLTEPLFLEGVSGRDSRYLKRFKLLAMAADYTYIENRIGLGILDEAGIMPLFYKYVEFRINGETQGLYMLIEDPEQYFRDKDSEFILRRGYNHRIDDAEYEPSNYFFARQDYEESYEQIYRNITSLAGEELYEASVENLNMKQYFRKMGIDYLLQNGDYTDEIFLYALIRNGAIQYQIIPWDYDDLFRDVPHEVGVSWGTGTLFGKRNYESLEAQQQVLGGRLIFSIEDDLDYAISQDDHMYREYENTITQLFSEMDENSIKRLFTQIRTELRPYYSDTLIVAQSRFDQISTTKELWEENMRDKEDRLLFRLDSIQAVLKRQRK